MPDSPASRLRVAFDLHDAGVDMMRQTLRRRHPDASESELSALLQAWLLDKPLPVPTEGARVYTPEEWERRR